MQHLKGNETEICEYIYRDKYSSYWKSLGKNTLRAYPKQPDGDPKNPLNGISNVEGIFFSANVNWSDGQPKTPALFGDRRLLVPFEVLYNDEFNVYFNDFYCMTDARHTVKDIYHNVTLVVCEPGGEEDKFCVDRLVKLDIRNNPFLQIRGNYCNVSKYIFVEIFHTAESIRNVSPYYDLVQVEGPDHPPLALSGREKIKTCTVCNI